MSEADPDTSKLVDLKHVSAPLFSIPGFFGAKGDSDAGKSPTSPLDFGVFANFGGLFSPRSPSSPKFGHRNKWGCDKVGLSVLSSSSGDGHNSSFRRENIVLAPQIKVKYIDTEAKPFLPCVKSNSMPKDYAAAASFSYVRDTNSVEEHTLTSPRRSSSSPVDIVSSQIYARSLSGREMALSEDYTCIISHGPNPQTTHIFGDCILDCDPKELGTKEEIEIPEPDSLPSKCLDDTVNQLCLCAGKPQDCHNSHMDREISGEKAGVEEDSLEISPRSSYNAMFYGTAVWDPWLIVGQIICLQCSYYLTLGLFLMVFLGLRVPRLSLVYLFDFATLTTSSVTGWCVIATFLFSSLAVAWYMVFLVERARKCLDFSATLYIIHLFLCIMYGGWPASMAWWVVNGTGLTVMALLAEYLCIKREQREIPMDRFHSRV